MKALRILTFVTRDERERWNTFVRSHPNGHLMQLCEWGEFKVKQGWRVHRLGVARGDELVAGVQVLFQPLGALPLSIAYVPKGPVVDIRDQTIAKMLLGALHDLARAERAVFIKVEPNFPDEPAIHDCLETYGFQMSEQTNQPRSTIMIDLAPGEENVLAAMRKKTRKLVRRAARDGIEVTEGDKNDLEAFYQVLSATSDIKDFSIHDLAFYQQAWEAFSPSGIVRLLLARYEGEVVAGKMIFLFGDRSLHFWGGTTTKGRDIFASYLIQWEAIKLAIRHGCRYTDLWGIPDEIGQMLQQNEDIPKDRQGALWGVYNFKRGFGDVIETYVGAYDYAYSRPAYFLGTKMMTTLYDNDTIPQILRRLRSIGG